MKNRSNNIERIIYLMQTDDSVSAPADALSWSKNIFRTRALSGAEPKRSIINKVLAVLKMDLAPGRAAFGERSASSAQARQMLFEAGSNSIDLRITKTEKGVDIRGQILGEGFADSAVRMGGFETTTDHLSEFRFTGLPHDDYDLTVRSDETEIVVEGLRLK